MSEEKKEEKKEVVFYCKDCEELVDTNRVGKKFVYKCKKCDSKNVAFGTERSIYNFFHLKDRDRKEEQGNEDEKVRVGN